MIPGAVSKDFSLPFSFLLSDLVSKICYNSLPPLSKIGVHGPLQVFNNQRWHGLARVVGQEKKVILLRLRHGGHILSIKSEHTNNSISWAPVKAKNNEDVPCQVTDCDKFWRLGFKSSSENNFIDIIDVAKISCTRVKAASRLHFLSAWQTQF